MKTVTRYLQKIARELTEARLLQPAIVASTTCAQLSKGVAAILESPELVHNWKTNLMGRDVVLIHAGETGWEEAVELVCRQCPSRLFVVAPELPRVEALKLEWVADMVIVAEETYTYEVHELGLSA